MVNYIPLNDLILIKKDETEEITKGGIVLPDAAKNPIIITGRIVSISESLKDSDKLGQIHFEELDKVIYDPRQAFPASLDRDNKMFLVHLEDILAIVRES